MIAALLLCILALSCAGCANLDEMKADHAVWKNEEKTELEWQGSTYKLLPTCSELEIFRYRERSVYATTADVPVMLSAQFGDRIESSADGLVLQTGWIADYDNDLSLYFCRADQYEEMYRLITQGAEMTKMSYCYWDYEDDEQITYTLTAEQMAAVEAVLQTTPVLIDHDNYDDYFSVDLYRTAENPYFRRMLGYISSYEGNYRIIVPNVKNEIYSIPEDLQPLFAEMMKPYEIEYGYYEK